MTGRVDFYILNNATPKQRLTYACRLTEKAYLRDLKVVVLSETAAETEMLDDLLWTFNDRSFVPHMLLERGAAAAATPEPAASAVPAASPVQLTPDLEAVGTADLLVNLSSRLPVRLERFARIAEVIDADAERRRAGRERYKAYRDLELQLELHQLDAADD